MNLEQLRQQIGTASGNIHKLVLVVGYPGSGKSSLLRQIPTNAHINLSKELSVKLLPIPKEKRSLHVIQFLREILTSYPDKTLVLDNIGILFLPELNLDPLKILAEFSQEKTLVIAWVGRYDGDELTWDDPGNPIFNAYATTECPYPVVNLDN